MTRSFRGLATLALAITLAAPALRAGANAVTPLAADLRPAVGKAQRAASQLAVHVIDLETGDTVFEHDADTPLIAASNTKLITTAVALDRLGPGYFFETRVLLRGVQRGEALVGDLAVVGAGDPNISGRNYYGDPLAVFRGWARELRELGIRRVEGDLLLANGRFDGKKIHPDWPRDQLTRWYEAPVDALSFSDNCVLVRVFPGAAPGLAARVELVPDLGILHVSNLARTTSSIKRHNVVLNREPGSDEIQVSGWVFRGARPLESWVTVPEPAVYFGAALLRALEEGGVQVTGRARPIERLPDGVWQRVTVHRSDLLSTLDVTNWRSQNFYAESLFKLLGAELCGEGSWEAGKRVAAEFLAGLGIAEGAYELADGSGMSRKNRFTPRQLTLLLRHMFFHRNGVEFAQTLPFSGGDHHRWSTRLATFPYRGNVMAKTGTLRAVSALSGYAKARSGKTYAFSILCNRTRSAWEARAAQDAIVRALIDNG